MRVPVEIGTHRDGTPRKAHRWAPDPTMKDKVLRAFELRAAGASLGTINRETGLYKSINCYKTFWPNKLFLGILEFGDYTDPQYCEPIVPRDLWDKVQEIQNNYVPAESRNSGDVRNPRRASSRFLLSGLAKCGVCGSPHFGRSSKNRSGSLSDSYICTRAYRNRDCTKARIPRAILEDEVIRIFREIILRPENIDQLYQVLASDQAGQLEADQRRQADLTAELTKVRRQITNITNAIAEKSHSTALLERLSELEKKEAELVKTQSEHTRNALQPVPQISDDMLRLIIEDMQTTLAEGSLEERQYLLRTLINEVRVRREGDSLIGEIHYFYPPDLPPKVFGGPDKRAVSSRRTTSGPPSRRHSMIVVYEFAAKIKCSHPK